MLCVCAVSGIQRLNETRAFTAPFMVEFEDGVGHVRNNRRTPHGALLKFKLITGEFSAWKDLPDVKMILYEVVGDFSPPLSEDRFARLDSRSGGKCLDPLQMEAEEALLGLKIIHTGFLPIATLISNRSKPVINDSSSLTPLSAGMYNPKNIFNARKIPQSVCRLYPHTADSQRSALANQSLPEFCDVEMTSDAVRVLADDSRFDS